MRLDKYKKLIMEYAKVHALVEQHEDPADYAVSTKNITRMLQEEEERATLIQLQSDILEAGNELLEKH